MNPNAPVKSDPRRELPAVDRLVAEVHRAGRGLSAWAVAAAVRRVLADERARLAAPGGRGEAGAEAELVRRAGALAAELAAPRPTRVVNATGVVLHTNLGRAPLAEAAAAAAAEAGRAYSDLELDRATGRRGDRQASLARKLTLLTGAEAALAVNNNAAALLLALDTLARGREVVVSRGELVEIGGSFRVPEIVERAGVKLVEVGATNRTHRGDYERAIGPDTALLLKVHRSNFEQRGFVSQVDLPELVEIGRARGLPVVEDLGSAALVDLRAAGLPAEVHAQGRLELGADAICFSGDKLLGGPQAGILLGRKLALDAMAGNPLARALRLDKLCLAALDWTLTAYLEGRAQREIPVLRLLLTPAEQLEARARALAQRLAKVAGPAVEIGVDRDRTLVGGGSLPGFELDSWTLVLHPECGAEAFARLLRQAAVPILTRVREGRVLLDVRTLLDGDEMAVETAVRDASADAAR